MIELNKIYQESCLDTINRMDDNSIDCVITSPPYWQLRDYGYAEQWGLEPTFQEYLEHLWSLMDGIYRVLKTGGTVWINLGDTYGGGTGIMGAPTKWKDAGSFDFEINRKGTVNKCLMLIPHRFAIGCIDRGWIVRNDIIWAKRNGMPESVTDRFSKKHEYFFFMVKSEKYFFDLNAIKTPYNKKLDRWGGTMVKGDYHSKTDQFAVTERAGRNMRPDENGKNPGSVSDFWDIPTKPSSEKHYASYNDSLLVKPVLAGCPEGGIIYDPFMGTGSTAEVALRSNRKFIGSEMKPEYCEIAEKRLKPYLQQIKLF